MLYPLESWQNLAAGYDTPPLDQINGYLTVKSAFMLFFFISVVKSRLIMALQVLAFALCIWSDIRKSKREFTSEDLIDAKVSPPKKSSVPVGAVDQGLDLCIESLMKIEQRSQFHWVKLLIEWDKLDAIRVMFKDIESNHYFNKASLNHALQVALENDR